MDVIQLNPPLDVRVVEYKDWHGPIGAGMAIFRESHPDLNTVYTVAMDETGQLWDVPAPALRLSRNITWGRK
jgi:hypothetical protein